LIQGATLGLSAAASPGPFQAYVISQSLREGWRRTLPACLAPLVSDGPIILMMVVLLTRLPEVVLLGIQLAGGLLLLYFAWGAFQAYRGFDRQPGSLPQENPHSLLRAASINLLSPGPYLYWSLIAGPILVAGWRTAPALGGAFLLGFYGMLVGGLAGLILLFSSARRLGRGVNKALIGLSAVLLFGFGIYQTWQALSRLGV
jgi:threonine/homoserine/homoserine lactone efflux protein